MGSDSKIKHFLDSVHGTINIPSEYCDKIIDTCYFQRLRRIEQNSCRSVFPSARHDRFIHSLGVFHLGMLIVDSIKNKCNNLPKNAEKIFNTYKMACLLHDVGHTPFSHTFEEFFDRDCIEAALKAELNNSDFSNDIDNGRKAAHHEALSAYISLIIFKDVLLSLDVDLELLVRMITGYKYLNNNIPVASFENSMIELIHGDMIDADGLDYVCRDVWAGGYRNFTIDIDRLINSIEIVYNNTSGYSVAYNAKALNEIETVLNIKNFQYLYVIKHHKVLLEQYLLVEAMKFTACYHLDLPDDSADERDNALRSLCDYHAYITPKSLSQSKYKLHRPTDDDFVALMKLYDTENMYIKQWFSRKYDATPLWKSKMEYFSIFKPVFQSLPEEEYKNIHTILMSPECKHFLCTKFNLQEKDIIVIEVKPKLRKLEERIFIKLNDNIKPYSELSHDMFSVVGTELPFCYMYINFNALGVDDKIMHIKTIISRIKDFLLMELREKWDE